MADKRIYVIAGPNGAGKTTFAMRYLPSEMPGLHFVNADLIAAGLSPLNRGTGVEAAAGRLRLAAKHAHLVVYQTGTPLPA